MFTRNRGQLMIDLLYSIGSFTVHSEDKFRLRILKFYCYSKTTNFGLNN